MRVDDHTSSGNGHPATSLREIAWLFLKLGTIAFGGPAAHIAMMEEEVVIRRGWVTRGEFLDYLGATNLIPGPNSTEMAIHIGHKRAGWPGLVVAGASFILPAAVLVTLLAWVYVRFETLPVAAPVLIGVKPVVIAVVVQALWRLARTALRSRFLAVLGVLAVVASVFGMNELLILALTALFALLSLRGNDARTTEGTTAMSMVPVGSMFTVAGGVTSVGLWPLFGVFFKIGAVLFGSGYVLLAFLRADLVQRLHWLTEHQLLDAVAVGQVTPGPVFTTATFVGYLIAGGSGALVATLGIFLPAFLFVAVSGPLIPRLRRSVYASAILDGVNVGSLALMGVVAWDLARTAIVNGATAVLALASAILLIRYRVNSAWLVLGGACVGLLLWTLE